MLLGVPLVPLVAVGSLYATVSLSLSLLLLPGFLPLFFIMRAITKADDRQFHLLWLKIKFRVLHFNSNGAYWKSSVYSPFSYFQREKVSKNESKK
jgi:type IV secretion system protein VirB4